MTLTPFTTSKGSFLAVQGLPGSTEEYEILGYYISGNKIWTSNRHIDLPVVDLPPGQWSVVGWSDELSEEQMENIVSGMNLKDGRFYRDYNRVDIYSLNLKNSFSSILISTGITGRALILKNEK